MRLSCWPVTNCFFLYCLIPEGLDGRRKRASSGQNCLREALQQPNDELIELAEFFGGGRTLLRLLLLFHRREEAPRASQLHDAMAKASSTRSFQRELLFRGEWGDMFLAGSFLLFGVAIGVMLLNHCCRRWCCLFGQQLPVIEACAQKEVSECLQMGSRVNLNFFSNL